MFFPFLQKIGQWIKSDERVGNDVMKGPQARQAAHLHGVQLNHQANSTPAVSIKQLQAVSQGAYILTRPSDVLST